MSMEIIRAGALTTVQDAGRKGYAARGFQENGACDQYNYRIANLLAGNFSVSRPEDLRSEAGQAEYAQPAVLEMTFQGAEIRFDSPAIVALTGADMKPVLRSSSTAGEGAAVKDLPAAEEGAVPMYRPFLVEAGSVLSLGMAVSGLRTYLAVFGGIDVPVVMGSRSTSVKCRLGGLEGRALKAGDKLPVGADPEVAEAFWKRLASKACQWPEGFFDYPLPPSGNRADERGQYPLLRAVAGPQQDAFTRNGLTAFETGVFELTAQSDRMACRLKGAKLETEAGSDIISDGIVAGSVQVASDGTPMIMMADHQTTGGYAKIATVISADLPRLAQLRPGDRLGFRLVNTGEAVLAAREAASQLKQLEEKLRQYTAN